MVAKRTIYARINPFDRRFLLADICRLAEAVNYSTRMKVAGVPDKRRRKILARWSPLPYALHKEMNALIMDLKRR